MQRDAEPPLHLGEQDDPGRQDLGASAIDAVAPGDLARRRRLDDPQRLGQLCLPELGADEPPRGAGASADGESGFDRGRVEVRERVHGLGAHVRGASRETNGAEIDGLDPVGVTARMPDGDLCRCAADVADGDPRGQGDVRGEDRAAVGERALFLFCQHPSLYPCRPRQRSDELVGIGRLAPGGREEDLE